MTQIYATQHRFGCRDLIWAACFLCLISLGCPVVWSDESKCPHDLPALMAELMPGWVSRNKDVPFRLYQAGLVFYLVNDAETATERLEIQIGQYVNCEMAKANYKPDLVRGGLGCRLQKLELGDENRCWKYPPSYDHGDILFRRANFVVKIQSRDDSWSWDKLLDLAQKIDARIKTVPNLSEQERVTQTFLFDIPDRPTRMPTRTAIAREMTFAEKVNTNVMVHVAASRGSGYVSRNNKQVAEIIGNPSVTNMNQACELYWHYLSPESSCTAEITITVGTPSSLLTVKTFSIEVNDLNLPSKKGCDQK